MDFLLVDGNSLINRAFYGVPILSNKKGEFTNAIYGFINMLNHIMDGYDFSAVAVAFDLKKPTFRHQMYKDYKAGRKPMPEELKEQFPKIKEWLKLMGYSIIEKEGFEADDIIGTLSRVCEESGVNCYIATGDRDSFQLVGKYVTVLNTVTKMGKPQIVSYTPQLILEKYGVEPDGMRHIKALQGDTSDNIPGVAGIGEKIAGSLISAYKTIDNIYENIDNLDIKDSIKNKLIAGKDSAYLSFKLGTICKQVPISENLNDYKIGTKDPKLGAFMAQLELFSLMNKMGITVCTAVKEEKPQTAQYTVGKVKEEKISVLISEDAVYFADSEIAEKCQDNARIKEILESESIQKQIYDLKNAYHYAQKHGIEIKNAVFDSLIGAYLLSPSSTDYSIDRLATEYSVPTPNIDTCTLVAVLYGLDKILQERIKEQELTFVLEKIEIPLARVLADMEETGFLLDGEEIKKLGENLGERINRLQQDIYALSGTEFNINSPKQLGEVLFEKLMLPYKKKTKSGYATGVEMLESLADKHAVIPLILEYRKLSKLKSTYCDGLLKCIDTDGRVHSTLNQTETRTGRISSTEPNLQNIPVRTQEGKEIRKFFKAKEGYVLIDADYSQIELRVLAHIASDQNMISAFSEQVDIHTRTASQVFGLPESMVTPGLRRSAKAVNFGIVYGIGAFSLAKDIGVTRKEASEYIESYLNYYGGIKNYMESVIEQAKSSGYCKTAFGRRRYLPELTSKNGMLRAFGERVARNMPIQGTAADIIKIAMVNVYNAIKKENLDAKIIMQVHDELILEVKESQKDACGKLLKKEMENAANFTVELVAETSCGKTWYDAKG